MFGRAQYGRADWGWYQLPRSSHDGINLLTGDDGTNETMGPSGANTVEDADSE